jgi:hypothetical protein
MVGLAGAGFALGPLSNVESLDRRNAPNATSPLAFSRSFFSGAISVSSLSAALMLYDLCSMTPAIRICDDVAAQQHIGINSMNDVSLAQ